MPCPSIPIPRGADFIGLHVSQVEADVHLPFPDAYRTFQLQQAIRSQQRAGEPLMLHAHTPGMIGYHVRREALKRRLRGKPIPFVATHSTRYQPFVETRTVEIVDALRINKSITFNELFTHGGLLERLIPAFSDTPEVRSGCERLMNDLRQMVNHWYSIPNQKAYRANQRWGQLLLWIASVGGRHSYHRLQGSRAAARGLRELAQLVAICAGVPLEEIWKRPFSSESLAASSVAEACGQLGRNYLFTRRSSRK